MKNSILLVSALILSAFFYSCDKEESVDTKSYIQINWMRNFNTCNFARSLCFSQEGINKTLVDQLVLEQDQAFTAPFAQNDGSIVMDMEIPYENLSEEAKILFFEEESLDFEEGFVLSETSMEAAYTNSGKTYAGQRLEVIQGLYPINRDGTGPPALRKIKITITFEPGKVTLTVTW